MARAAQTSAARVCGAILESSLQAEVGNGSVNACDAAELLKPLGLTEAAAGALTPSRLTGVYVAVILVLLAEVLFFLYLQLRAKRWRQPLEFSRGDFPAGNRPQAETLGRIEAYMSRSREHAEQLLSGYYFNAPMASITRQDCEEALAWAVYCRRRDELLEEEFAELDAALSRLVSRTGISWGGPGPYPGHRHSRQKFAAHTWEDSVSYRWMPLVGYLVLHFIHVVVDPVVLHLLGWKRRRHGEATCWVRHSRHCAAATVEGVSRSWDAIMFLHGLSVGRIFYLMYLMHFSDETLVVMDMPWVAFNPFRSQATMSADFCEQVADLLDAEGLSRVCTMAHSYGSFATAWCLFSERMKSRVARVVLVSSPALFLFHPKTCQAVLYERPFWFEYTFAHNFFRQFFWYESCLHADELPAGSLVVLSEQDEMIPVADVVQDCVENSVKHLVLPGMKHGFELFWPSSCFRVAAWVRKELATEISRKDQVIAATADSRPSATRSGLSTDRAGHEKVRSQETSDYHSRIVAHLGA